MFYDDILVGLWLGEMWVWVELAGDKSSTANNGKIPLNLEYLDPSGWVIFIKNL